MSMDEVLESYDRAWNEPDDHERRRLLEAALTDRAELVDPRGRFQGREAIEERISGFRDRFPGARSTSPLVSTSTTDSLGMSGRSSALTGR